MDGRVLLVAPRDSDGRERATYDANRTVQPDTLWVEGNKTREILHRNWEASGRRGCKL